MKEQKQKQLGVEGINPSGENPRGENPTNDSDASLLPTPPISDDHSQIDDESYFSMFPPGYRFKPYDVEGINPGGEYPSGENPTNDSDASLPPHPPNADDHFQIGDESYFAKFPPGYRFKPYDVELVIHYLQKKILNEPLPPNQIQVVELYRYNPKALAESCKSLGEKEWYFFTPRDRKYRNGKRPNRAAADGYWKATGADKPVRHNDNIVGFRKALVFYKGKAPKGDKTNWIMHEYRVNNPPKIRRGGNDMRLDDWVLCRIQLKSRPTKASTRKPDNSLQVQQSEGETPAQSQESGQFSVDDSKMLATENFKPEAHGLFDMSDYCSQGRFFNTNENVLLFCQSPYVNFSHCQSSQNWLPGFSQSYHHALGFQHNPGSVAESLPSSRLPPLPTESHMKPDQFGYLTDEVLKLSSEDNYFDPLSHNFTNF